MGRAVPLPPLAMSDNANAAVSTSRGLEALPLRCGPHLLQIIVRRLFFFIKDDSPSANDICPPLLQACYCLREVARRLCQADVAAFWQRSRLGGSKHALVHLDSSTDWGSTLAMIRAGLRWRDDLATLQSRFRGKPALPALPSADQWAYLAIAEESLQMVEHAMSVLQSDHSRAAQILPVFQLLADELADAATADEHDTCPFNLPALLAEELARVQREHLKRPWQLTDTNPFAQLAKRVRLQSYYDLLEIAALLATGGVGLPDEAEPTDTEADTICARLERFLLHASGDAPSARVPAPRQAPVGSADSTPTKRKGSTGAADFRTKLQGAAWRATSSKVLVPQLSTKRERVAVQLRAFLGARQAPGAASGRAILQWWKAHIATFPDLEPGIRILLALPAGNAYVERTFGKCRSVMTPGHTKSQLQIVLLRCNAPQLGMPDYPPPSDMDAHDPTQFSAQDFTVADLDLQDIDDEAEPSDEHDED